MGRSISGESTWRRSRLLLPVAQPAAGAEWLATVPAGHVYTLLGVFYNLATSGVAGSRSSRLVLGDGTGSQIIISPPATVPASTTGRYTWLPSSGYQNSPAIVGALPGDWQMPAGWTVGSSTVAVDVGDQYSGVVLGIIDSTARDGSVDLDAPPDFRVVVVEAGPD